MLKIRLEDLIESDNFILENKEDIIKAITKLDEEFIINNKERIYNLIKMLKSNKYNMTHRRMLCYIDKALYKNKFLATKKDICNIEELEVACE